MIIPEEEEELIIVIKVRNNQKIKTNKIKSKNKTILNIYNNKMKTQVKKIINPQRLKKQDIKKRPEEEMKSTKISLMQCPMHKMIQEQG